jgi:hypothetical protein
MAGFNLDSYETVEERHARAIALHPDLRCVLVNHTTSADREKGVWVVEARVYLNADDQLHDLPKAVEWAFEVDGQGRKHFGFGSRPSMGFGWVAWP